LRMILHHTGIPAIYVTHDQEEAFTIADRVLILHDGRIVCEGTPVDVWSNPGSAFVAGFLGLGNILKGRVLGRMLDASWEVSTEVGIFNVRCMHEHHLGDSLHLLVRPLPAEEEPNTIQGAVRDVIFQQDRFKVAMENGLYVYLPKPVRVGEKIQVPVKVECLT